MAIQVGDRVYPKEWVINEAKKHGTCYGVTHRTLLLHRDCETIVVEKDRNTFKLSCADYNGTIYLKEEHLDKDDMKEKLEAILE
jgi:hypothetical protein